MNLHYILWEKITPIYKAKEVWRAEIKELEQFTGYELPEWYKSFLRFDLDGFLFEFYRNGETKAYSLATFFNLHGILNDLSNKCDEEFDAILEKKMIPLATDGDGWGDGNYFYLLPTESGVQVVEMYHDSSELEYGIIADDSYEFFLRMKVLRERKAPIDEKKKARERSVLERFPLVKECYCEDDGESVYHEEFAEGTIQALALLTGCNIELHSRKQATFLDRIEANEYEEAYEVKRWMPNSTLVAVSSQCLIYTNGKGFCLRGYGDLDEDDSVYLGFDLVEILSDPILVEEAMDY